MKTSPNHEEIFNCIAWRKDLDMSAGLERRVRRIIKQQNMENNASCFLAAWLSTSLSCFQISLDGKSHNLREIKNLKTKTTKKNDKKKG